jgi:hypothetical protein
MRKSCKYGRRSDGRCRKTPRRRSGRALGSFSGYQSGTIAALRKARTALVNSKSLDYKTFMSVYRKIDSAIHQLWKHR